MNTNSSENLFQSFDTIIDWKLQQITVFDKTEICTIVSQDKDNKNKYWVSNEAGLRYEAYNIGDSKNEYLQKQKVYVTIPQGKYEFKKIILGAYEADEKPKPLYINPFKNLIPAEEVRVLTGIDYDILWVLPEGLEYSDKLDDSKTLSDLVYKKNGLGQYNYLGVEFAMTTGFGGTKGDFEIHIGFNTINNDNQTEKLDEIVITNKDLYGNPYYLNDSLKFQYVFDISKIDFTIVKQISVTLKSLAGFNFQDPSQEYHIELNELTLYLGYDSEGENMSSNKVALVLDNPSTGAKADFEYQDDTDIDLASKKMSIDWLNIENTTIYNETFKQYPKTNKYTIYWLQYFADVLYEKKLETDKSELDKCYYYIKLENDVEVETHYTYKKYINWIDQYFSDYSEALRNDYKALWDDDPEKFEQNCQDNLQDIEESGPYWKTVQREDANTIDAYQHTLKPRSKDAADKYVKQEQIKVMIKNNTTGEYLTSNGFKFTNSSYPKEELISKIDNLKLTLNDSGIYNQYGIDNKLITTNNNEHTVTVDYADTTVWDDTPQIVTWKIPVAGSMISPPKQSYPVYQKPDEEWEQVMFEGIPTETPDGYYIYIIDPEQNTQALVDKEGYVVTDDTKQRIQIGQEPGIAAEWTNENGYYVCSYQIEDDSKKTISFEISNQFGYNKINNTIICEIKKETDGIELSDTNPPQFIGEVTLQFGTQGTSGSSFAFNIYPMPNGSKALNTNDENSQIEFYARLENNSGEEISFREENVKWYFLYGAEEIGKINAPTGKNYIVTAEVLNNRYKKNNESLMSNYAVLVAELSNIYSQSAGGGDAKPINLKAYYPIPQYAIYEDIPIIPSYMEGASRIIYNYQGAHPNFDETPYALYTNTQVEIPDLSWVIRHSQEGNEAYAENLPSLIIDNDKVILKPLNNMLTNPMPCYIQARQVIDDNITFFWSHPILTLTSEYAFGILNNWSGELAIDEENNTILSQLIGAGIKDENNTYTGVLMGAVGKYGSAKTGLYGFETGNLVFKLDEKGAFYVGTGDDNCISFNDIDKGTIGKLSITTKDLTIKTDDLILDSTASGTDSVFKFQEKFNLQADGKSTIAGWDIMSRKIQTGGNDSGLLPICIQAPSSPKSTVFAVGGKNDHSNYQDKDTRVFWVNASGKLFAKDADIEGKITATSGSVANWNIQQIDYIKIGNQTKRTIEDTVLISPIEQLTYPAPYPGIYYICTILGPTSIYSMISSNISIQNNIITLKSGPVTPNNTQNAEIVSKDWFHIIG